MKTGHPSGTRVPLSRHRFLREDSQTWGLMTTMTRKIQNASINDYPYFFCGFKSEFHSFGVAYQGEDSKSHLY
jgi:hypothetical protein